MITIINYGLSNLLSVKRAFSLFSDKVIITDSVSDVMAAEKLVLPGVGAFKDGMTALNNLGLSEAINYAVSQGKPLLGICLGMQMLFETSSEGGLNKGLGFIKGKVEKIPIYDEMGEQQNVPHIGWNVLFPPEGRGFQNTLLENVPLNGEVYFVHSYEGQVIHQENVLAYTEYGGRKVCAAVNAGNIFGCQFHPEKSGTVGLSIVENFVKI